MEIIVNGKYAVIKSNTSFQYVSENRAFTNAEAYSLNITFPLVECPENIDIFGLAYRSDVEILNYYFSCEIRDGEFVKYGRLTVTSIDETSLKGQFLEGKCEMNFDKTLDETYINDLDLGYPVDKTPPTPAKSAWNDTGRGYVALPWLNVADGSIQNEVVKVGNEWQWAESVESLSFFPYLLFITKKICEALGMTANFVEWEKHDIKSKILVCNTLPSSWNVGFASALPHWTVNEYFDYLGAFLQGEFNIDYKSKNISFNFYSSIQDTKEVIKLENVVDSFSMAVENRNSKIEFSDVCNVKYADCDHEMWKYYSCDWLLKEKGIRWSNYDTIEQLIHDNAKYKRFLKYWLESEDNPVHRILYAKDIDTYFVLRCIKEEYVAQSKETFCHCVLQPINVFGSQSPDIENEFEIKISPAWIDFSGGDYGQCIFLNIQGNPKQEQDAQSYDDFFQPIPVHKLEQGEKSKNDEYLKNLFVGFFNGQSPDNNTFSVPAIDKFYLSENWTYYPLPFVNFRLGSYPKFCPNNAVAMERKFTFSFLADNIPNVRGVFFIDGSYYICEKITATFTVNGLSKMMKGEFYKARPL